MHSFFVRSSLLTLCALGVAAHCAAQTVRLENLGTTTFTGWKRTTVDVLPPHTAGNVNGSLYVVGRQVGLNTRVVDVRVTLAPGQSRTLNLASSTAATWTRGPLPANPTQTFGGAMTLAGQPMNLQSVVADGAGYTGRYRKRTGTMLCTDVWVTWYPDQLGWAHAEAIVTASNPAITDLTATAPANLHLRFGDAITAIPGAGVDVPLVAANTPFADGQARALPLTFLWGRHLATPAAWASAYAAASLHVGAVGIGQLLADGNPRLPNGFAARPWTLSLLAPAAQVLHTWDPPLCGPDKLSSVSGAQEDQVFVRGEALRSDGVGAEIVTYLSALKLANRPCHHLENSGSLLNLGQHVNPLLVFWDGRPHWHTGVSPDRLGKLAGISANMANGWWGPDVEHALFNTLAAGARYTGSPALQHLLGAIARVYLLQWTATSGWATSQPYAARAVGWEGVLTVHLWRELEDRPLANAVRQRWRDRYDLVLAPWLATRVNDVWDPRLDDARLGPGWRWMPWQQAVGAYGLDLAGAQFDRPAARACALAAAKAVLRDGYLQQGGQWTTRDVVAMNGAPVPLGTYNLFGMPLASGVVLRHEPQQWPARPIWTQLQTQCNMPKHTAWLAPGVQ